MKPVHHATRRAIIRANEKKERLVIVLGGKRVVDMSLYQLKLMNGIRGLPAELILNFDSFTLIKK